MDIVRKLSSFFTRKNPSIREYTNEFMGTSGATLTNGKRVYNIFDVGSVTPSGVEKKKDGFYATYCNKSDEPGRKPDSHWRSMATGKNLRAYWINISDLKKSSGKGTRKRNRSIRLRKKKDLDEFCGKTVTQF